MARYSANYGEVGRWLRSDAGLRSAVRAEAERIASRARALAPVRTGRYKASIGISSSRGWDGRVAEDVAATAPYSVIVESRHHVLRKAVEGS